MSVYNTQEIMEILPHRHPFLLIDTIEELEPGVRAVGRKNVTFNEPYFAGHFPGNPVVPGVILCEMLAQSACILLADDMTEDKLPMYTGLNNVRFKSPVKPGDVFETRCIIRRAKPPFYFAEGTGSVEGRVCITAEFSFAVMGK